MYGFVNTWMAGVNEIGRGFWNYAAGMFVQSGMLIVALLLVDLVLRKRVRATLRYWIWMLVFVKLLLPPSLSLPTGIGYWIGGYVTPPASILPTEATHAPDAVSMQPEVAARTEVPVAQASRSEVAPAMVEPVEFVASVPHAARLTWQGGVFLLWGIGVLVFTAWVIRRLCFVRRLITQAEPAQGPWLEVLDQCRRRIGVRGPIAMKVSARSFSPAVCGLWRPTVLMPASLLAELSPRGLRAVLIHELAHIKRADLWVNCLQTALQIVYFYNPLVWLANAIARRMREQAVDEMALVALGAEAGSYGPTLIDIAEMTFWRARPALGLVGVAESKKSVEGRIRHMISRPIPKDARVGFRGVVALVTLGAAVLPMAAARTQTPGGKLAVRLSNGATVELVGVCHWPTQEPVCWKADGSRLDSGLHPARWSSNPSADDYGFMAQVTGPDTPELSWGSIEGAQGRHSEADVVDRQGKPVPGGRALIVSLPGARAETTVRVAVAAGPWTTLASHNGNGMLAETGPEEGFLWSPAFQDTEGVRVMATTQWHRDRATRIVAVDKEGMEHTASRRSTVASGNVGQMTDATFQGLPRDDIQKFEFQVRPYEAVAFEGVSLVPGQKSTVTITGGSLQEKAARAGGAVSGLDKAIARKEYSHTCLANLGKAVLLYANDHADQLPPTIEKVREYLNSVEVEWLLANAAYLGKDLSVADYPGRVVAYDKTLWAEGEGTNVLYLDSHVDFENLQELERLGIPSARRDAALRTYEVNRSVVEFPRVEDFATPEAAYATINRIDRGDPSAWQKVSVAALAERFARESGGRKTAADPEWATVLSDARILQVMVWNNTRAAVVARLPQGLSSQKIVAPIDVRYLELENGRWLNTGNDRFWTVEEARAKFAASWPEAPDGSARR
jgi:beta-lactamase regulating signal transducer with metallopeptidase domain